jgi:hypothetical protein
MNGRLAHALTRLYSAQWQARYGEEFALLLETLPATSDVVLDTLVHAAASRRRSIALGALVLVIAVVLSTADANVERSRNVVAHRAATPSPVLLACRSYSSAAGSGWIARQACLD